MKHITGGWLKSAKSDLVTIEEILGNDQLTHVVAFHSQQCIEKTFKAIVEEFELTSIKTHDLITPLRTRFRLSIVKTLMTTYSAF